MGMVHGPNMVTDGLVMYYDAGNVQSYPGSGTAVNDLSGYGNNGTIANTTYSSADGGQFVFDGSGDTLSVVTSQDDAQAAMSGFGSMTGADNVNWSIDLWIKTTQSAGASVYNAPGIIARSSGDIYANLNVYNGKVLYTHYNGSWIGTPTSTTSVSDGVWHHVVFVNHSNETGDIYIDAIQEADGVSTAIVGSNYFSPDYFGLGYSGQYFNGSLTLMKFYDKALSAAEVLQNYNAHKSRFGL